MKIQTISARLTLAFLALPLSLSAQSYIARMWDGHSVGGDAIAAQGDSLTFTQGSLTWTVATIHVRAIEHDGLDVTVHHMSRDQIDRASVRAIYADQKSTIGSFTVGRLDPALPVRLMFSDGHRDGKITRMDDDRLLLVKGRREGVIKRSRVFQAVQGTVDVSRDVLTPEGLVEHVGRVEDPYKLGKAMRDEFLSAVILAPVVVPVTGAIVVGSIMWLANTGGVR